MGAHAPIQPIVMPLFTSTAEGAVPPPGAPAGRVLTDSGAWGAPFLPLTGGILTGPLYYTATGANTSRSAQDRAAEHYSAMDFGCVCDGVTDDGAALNAALAAIPPGTTLYVPASVYTTRTILINNGRRIAMPPGAVVRPYAGALTLEATISIIGSATLSPVVLVQGNEGGLSNVFITRNGTPSAAAIGLQCTGQNQLYSVVRSYNHGIGIQVGAFRAAPVNTFWSALNIRFDHCMIWRCYQHFLYLVNAPGVTCFDMWFGTAGEIDPSGATALVMLDGDGNVNSDAGTTNTVSFERCQFNTGGDPLYSIMFWQYGSPDGGIRFTDCYSGGAQNAFLYIDPSCNVVRNVNLTGCTISPLHAAEVLVSDTAKRMIGFVMMGNHVAGGRPQPAAGFYMSGTSCQVIGNIFNGAFTVQLDSMTAGVFSGNTMNTLSMTGAFTGPFVCANNNYTTITQTATGQINYIEPWGNYGSQLTLGRAGQAGRVDFKRGTDGQLLSWVGISSAAGASTFGINHIGGNALLFLNAGDTAGTLSLQVNGTEVIGANAAGATVTGTALVTGVAHFAGGARLDGGNSTVGNATQVNPSFSIQGAAASQRMLQFISGSATRWTVEANGTAEGGSDAGSDFVIISCHDNGSAFQTPFKITRSTGAIQTQALSCSAFGLSASGGQAGRQTVTGAKGSNAALASLLTALAAFGLITDSTTA